MKIKFQVTLYLFYSSFFSRKTQREGTPSILIKGRSK
jgi:hypothetical protein